MQLTVLTMGTAVLRRDILLFVIRLELNKKLVFKIIRPFCGGTGHTGGVCGAVIGALLVLRFEIRTGRYCSLHCSHLSKNKSAFLIYCSQKIIIIQTEKVAVSKQ
jgi:prolipoprotein diacylglyceryltransferase